MTKLETPEEMTRRLFPPDQWHEAAAGAGYIAIRQRDEQLLARLAEMERAANGESARHTTPAVAEYHRARAVAFAEVAAELGGEAPAVATVAPLRFVASWDLGPWVAEDSCWRRLWSDESEAAQVWPMPDNTWRWSAHTPQWKARESGRGPHTLDAAKAAADAWLAERCR